MIWMEMWHQLFMHQMVQMDLYVQSFHSQDLNNLRAESQIWTLSANRTCTLYSQIKMSHSIDMLSIQNDTKSLELVIDHQFNIIKFSCFESHIKMSSPFSPFSRYCTVIRWVWQCLLLTIYAKIWPLCKCSSTVERWGTDSLLSLLLFWKTTRL